MLRFRCVLRPNKRPRAQPLLRRVLSMSGTSGAAAAAAAAPARDTTATKKKRTRPDSSEASGGHGISDEDLAAAAAAASTGSTRSDKRLASVIDRAQHDVFTVPLGLDSIPTPHTRPRTHANPLNREYTEAVEPPDWSKVFADPTRPLCVDVGCAAGRFGLLMAKHDRWKDHNHLGLEIRGALVERANLWVQGLHLTNAHYIKASANFSLEALANSYPGPLAIVAVQFPDPHFKRKHHKRRVVQPAFLDALSRIMPEGALLFLQSDVEEALAEMRDRAQHCGYFHKTGTYAPRDALLDFEKVVKGEGEEYWTVDGKRALPRAEGTATADAGNETLHDPAAGSLSYGDYLLGPNPVGVPTEREVQNEALNLPIYRATFVRRGGVD